MLMVERANQIIKEMEVAEKYLMGMIKPEDLADALDDEGVKVFKSYVNLMRLSKDLMLEGAINTDNVNFKLNSIESKLDKLLEQKQD